MSGRSRIWRHQLTEAGQGEQIDLTYVLPFNATLLQWIFTVNVAPTVDNIFAIVKLSGVDAQLNCTVYECCPFTDGSTEYLCNGNIEFRKGDSVYCRFANDDDQVAGVELCFREGD